jgi:hypothetical protein
MMFVWWLMKRAVQPVVDYWNRPGDKEHYSGKETIGSCMILFIWVIVMLSCSGLSSLYSNPLYFILGLTFPIPIMVIVFRADIRGYFANLHAEYRAEQPEKPKRKRKRKNDDTNIDNWELIMRELIKDRHEFVREQNKRDQESQRDLDKKIQDLRRQQAKSEREKEQARQSYEDGCNTASEYIDELFYRDGE